MPTSPADTQILRARWIAPVAPEEAVLHDHAVVVEGDGIAALLPLQDAQRRYPHARVVDLDEHILIPGLVNAHTHAAMTLMRGIADDLPLMRWLEEHIWPAEAKHVSPEFVHDGTLLAIAESLRGGVTCFNDMYFFPEVAAQAAVETGMRMSVGMIVIEFPTRYAADPQDYLAKGLAMRDALKREPRLSFCLAPHAPYTVNDQTFERVMVLAEQLDVPVHLHLHETIGEIQQSLALHMKRPIERMERLGVLSPRLIAVHAVHLLDEEIKALARNGCSIAHCPSSNLKLASGIAPVAECLDAGVNVSLGTDGAASNNRLDMFEEMRLAALLAKAASGKADVLPAHRALKMATLDGARALGLDRRIGSIEPGKQADLVAVNLSALELSPCFDPLSHLVYAASRQDVSHAWVDGQLLLSDGRLTRMDTEQLRNRVERWRTALIL
ncbi:MAG: TRZ/ATZ family hydrolase [Betaproteobacteria bacterium]|nr:TRZ/ATZ family hydrolase [Betaproteobacteria bacterium]